MVPPFNTGNFDYSLNHYYIDQPLLIWPWMDSLKSSLVSSGYVGYSNLIGFGIEFPHHSNFAPFRFRRRVEGEILLNQFANSKERVAESIQRDALAANYK